MHGRVAPHSAPTSFRKQWELFAPAAAKCNRDFYGRIHICGLGFPIYDLCVLNLEQLAGLLEKNRAAASARVKEFSIGGKKFNFNSQPALMGVINLSPDSWYRESVCLSAASAVRRGKVLAAQGADIVDIGAESTLAHAARVGGNAQNSRLLPVIKELRAARIPVSVETYSPAVARACLEAGANVLNLTGVAGSKEIFKMITAHDAAVIICYVAGKNVREVGDFDLSADSIPMMRDYFSRQIEIARRCGVEKIILDPGLGFYYRNLQDSAVRVRHQINVFLTRSGCARSVFPFATRCHTPLNSFATKSAAPSRSSPCWPRWARPIYSERTKSRASRPCWRR